MKVSLEVFEFVLFIIVMIGAILSYGKYRYDNGISPYSPKYKKSKNEE